MKVAKILINDKWAGHLEEFSQGKYRFKYNENYDGPPVSLTMPVRNDPYEYDGFPPFFEGLLPEGIQLQALLKREKIDEDDYITQLITVGADLVGAINVEPS